MNVRQKYIEAKNDLLSTVPSFESFYSEVNTLSSIPAISSVTYSKGNFEVGSMCYVSRKHANIVKKLVKSNDIATVLKTARWGYISSSFTEGQIAFAEVSEDKYIVFFNTVRTLTPISMGVGSFLECVRIYYDYIYSDYNLSLAAFCTIVQPSAKFDSIGLDLYSIEKYLTSLLELIMSSVHSSNYATEINGQYRYNTKFLCGDEPIIVQCTVNEQRRLTSLTVVESNLPPFNSYIGVDKALLNFADIDIEDDTLSHFLKTGKYPYKLNRKQLAKDLLDLVRVGVFGCQYIEDAALSHFYNQTPCLSFRFPDSDHYLVCSVGRKAGELCIKPKTVIPSRTAQILACTTKPLY